MKFVIFCFRIAKTGRFDVYRAANHLLRLTVEGRICMATYPPNFFTEEEKWKSETETKQLVNLVLRTKNDRENFTLARSEDDGSTKIGVDVHHLAVDGGKKNFLAFKNFLIIKNFLTFHDFYFDVISSSFSAEFKKMRTRIGNLCMWIS